MVIWHVVYELYKAWRRGERRIKGSPMRGRCFEKKDKSGSSGAPMASKSEPKLELTSMKVIRKDGTTEDIDCG